MSKINLRRRIPEEGNPGLQKAGIVIRKKGKRVTLGQ